MTKILPFAILFLSFSLYSQTTIKGIAKDQSDTLLLGNILLLSTADSSLIKGAHYDYGVFTISYDLTGPALVKLTSPGFEDIFSEITESQLGTVIDLGEITMTPITTELGGVEVTATVPLFTKSKEGGVIVNVEKTMLGSSNSLIEVLSKSPGVTISGNVISVVGKGEALLYKDGKRITFEQLGSISVQSVQKIEIITNPSAKYDAEGRAVINFIMIPNPSEGFEVAIIQNVIFAKHPLWVPALSVNYRNNKFSMNANYSATLGKDWYYGEYGIEIDGASGTIIGESANEDNTKFAYSGNHSVGFAYQFNKDHGVSVEYSGLLNDLELNNDGNNLLRYPNGDETKLSVHNVGNSNNFNNSISLNYNGNVDTLGSSIFFGGQYSKFRSDLDDVINEEIFFNNQLSSSATRNNLGINNIELVTARIDYNKIFKNGMSLEFGGKYGDVTNLSKIDLYSQSAGGTPELVPGYSNSFEYYEKIPAAYAQWRTTLSKKANLSMGVRGEYSAIRGVSNTLNQTVLDTTYMNIFPNATITYQHSDKWGYSLAYSSRISRPEYQDLDPFLWYQDSLTSVQGNPFLLPELIKSGEASVQFKSYSLAVGYNHSTNPSRTVIWDGTTGQGSVLLQEANFEFKDSWYTSLTVPFEVKFWRSYNMVNLTLDKYRDSRPEFQTGAPSPQLYLYSYNNFKVKNWFDIEAVFDYEGARNDGIYEDDARYSFSVGLAKYLMGGNLTLRFLANDVLQTYREKGRYTIGQITSKYDLRLNTNFYRFSVIYYFGKLKNVSYSNKRTGEDEFNRVKK